MTEDEMLLWYARQMSDMQKRFARMILNDLAESPLVKYREKYKTLKEKYESFLE